MDDVFGAVIDKLCEGSNTQINAIVKPRLQALKGKSKEQCCVELKSILDDCVYSALCSDFVIQVLDMLWKQCGGSHEQT